MAAAILRTEPSHTMAGNTLSKIIAASSTLKLETAEVEVPELGVTLTVRAFSGADTDAMARVVDPKRKGGELPLSAKQAHMIAHGVIDPDTGERVFGREHLGMIAGWPQRIQLRIINALNAINGEAETPDDLEKNFEAIPDDDLSIS